MKKLMIAAVLVLGVACTKEEAPADAGAAADTATMMADTTRMMMDSAATMIDSAAKMADSAMARDTSAH